MRGDSNEEAVVIASIARTASRSFVTEGAAKDEGQY
jgi:hypothetical protein